MLQPGQQQLTEDISFSIVSRLSPLPLAPFAHSQMNTTGWKTSRSKQDWVKTAWAAKIWVKDNVEEEQTLSPF